MYSKLSTLRLYIVTSILVLNSTQSQASIVTYDFKAKINSIFEYVASIGAIQYVESSSFLGPIVSNGNSVVGTFFYDTESPLSPYYQPLAPATGTYQIYSGSQNYNGMQFSIFGSGLVVYTTAGDEYSMPNLQVANNASTFGGWDIFYFGTTSSLDPSRFGIASINLHDPSGTVFQSSTIPADLNLQNFQFASLGAGYVSQISGNQLQLGAELTSLTPTIVSSVPEPETYAMLLTGLGIM